MYRRILKMVSEKSLFTDIFLSEVAETKLNGYTPDFKF